MTKLRLAFMGTPDFAVPSIRALIAGGHDIVAAYCQPARPAGRGHRARPSAVQQAAEAAGIAVRSPARLDGDAVAAFAALRLDAAVVAAYGLILPPAVLEVPPLGCLNIHASLLPRWRGAAPIQRAIMAGDKETGVMIMKMDEGLDTGAILLQSSLEIYENDDAATLSKKLSVLGARTLIDTLRGIRSGCVKPIPQQGEATYAPSLRKEDGRIDWQKNAETLVSFIRGMNPWPSAFCSLGHERIKITRAKAVKGSGQP
jgi:methionyl-tRNA formyltransferase